MRNILVCAAIATLVATLAFNASCSAPATRASDPTRIGTTAALPSVLSPESAAALAVERSPRVAAAAARLRADEARARAVALPPDPMIVVATGIPLDDMSSTPVRISVMAGISWLFTRDASMEAARARCTSSAAELVAHAAEVAAEARMLVRATIAAREGAAQADLAAKAAERLLASDEALLAEGELPPLERDRHQAMSAKAESERAMLEAEARRLSAALASLLALGELPELERGESTAPDIGSPHEPADVSSARKALASAQSMLAEARAGGDEGIEIGAGFERDMERDEAIGLEARIRLPLARRAHEVAALEAEVAAATAELAETERLARRRLHEATLRCERARIARDAAVRAADAGDSMRRTAQASVDAGELARHEADIIELEALAHAIDAAKAHIAWAEAQMELERLLLPNDAPAAANAATNPPSTSREATP